MSAALSGASATWISSEAIGCYLDGGAVYGLGMMLVAAIGDAFNYWQVRIVAHVHHDHHHDVRRTLNAHFQADMRNNIAIVIDGGVILTTSWYWVYIVLALWVVWYLIRQTRLLVRDPTKSAEVHAHH